MRAYVLAAAGATAAVTDAAEPGPPGAGEVRIRVRRSSVNPSDRMMAGGFFRWMEHRYPAVLGRDFAGVVDEVGEGVTRFAAGDEVFGFVKRPYVGDGTFAEYVTIPADRFAIHRPQGLSVEDAGVLGVAGATALQCVDALACAPGETVLVNGATGGVGAFAVQLARRAGLRVFATAHGDAAEQHIRGLGADATVDWTVGDVAAQVRVLAPDGVHGIVDLVSSDFDAITALAGPVLVPGRAVAATRSGAPDSADLAVHGIHCSPAVDLLHRLADAVLDGLVVPLVASYPLEKVDDAFAALSRAPLGKVGLEIG
ncbi:quinone oxidoreductase family protein [Cryptosporangium aurantiacum]|uniref:NADPH:quinone reductase n=1 Tax=Cryptosporangium aurantiacum TaxID=134849 RepID=A0A1M7TZ60_9ACTN|nr:NADP-dependent oxidoreductase [Cryptosporangium aurantiacum]SHN76036.1 NADPH:quinone reductase [Cryptosporangium aurantiacum]